MSTGKRVAKASVGVTLIMAVAHLISFIKEAIIANYFGISYMVDAYTVAIQVPVVLFSFVSVAIQSVVIPVCSDLLYRENKESAKKYIDHLITLLIIGTLALVILGEIFASGIIYLFAPGFDETTHELSTVLLRITFPSIIMAVVSQVLVAVINIHKNFVLPSVAVFFMNVSMIVFIIFLHAELGVASACIGQVCGDLLRMIFILIIARKYYHYSFSLVLKDASVTKTLKLSIPVFWSTSVSEVNTIVNRIVASMLFVGSISAITYASKINSVLMSLLVSSIASVVYPLYAESSAKGDLAQLNHRVNLTISAYGLFVIPLMCGVFVFKREIVEVAFARGAFDSNAVELTQNLLGLYAVGMLFMALRTPITNIYYSLKNTRTPAINATIGTLLNIGLNIGLSYLWGVQGLAIATSLTAVYITSSLLYTLKIKYKEIKLKYFFTNLFKVCIASVGMLVILYVLCYFISTSSIVKLIVGTVVGTLSYLSFLFLLRVPIAIRLLEIIHK